MANPDGSITDPNMLFNNPTPGVTPGQQYAVDLSTALTTIGAHDHTPGHGVPVTPSGLSINSTLAFNGQLLTTAKAVNFTTNTSTTGIPTYSLFFQGSDLYITNGAGQTFPITLGNSVAISGAVGFTGLPSAGASASYVSPTFIFQSNFGGIAANVDGASHIFRNITPSSVFGVTVSAIANLSSNYPLVLPIIPSVQGVMTLDNAGNMGTTTWDAVGQLMTSVGANAIGNTMNATGSNAVLASSTSSSLGGHGVLLANAGAQGAKTIWAVVNSSGSVTSGSGITLTSHPTTGVYLFSFNTAYAGVPAVILTSNTGGLAVISAAAVTTTGFTVDSYVAGVLADQSFAMLILG